MGAKTAIVAARRAPRDPEKLATTKTKATLTTPRSSYACPATISTSAPVLFNANDATSSWRHAVRAHQPLATSRNPARPRRPANFPSLLTETKRRT